MLKNFPARICSIFILSSTMFSCSSERKVDLKIQNVCNQDPFAGGQELELKPIGNGIDTGATKVNISAGSASDIEIPLTKDFQMEAAVLDANGTVKAQGVSLPTDTTQEDVSITLLLKSTNAFGKVSQNESCVSPTIARRGATATYIPAIKKVAIIGGQTDSGALTGIVELYDPVLGTFEKVGELPEGRVHHGASLVFENRVLVSGGNTSTEGNLVTLNTAIVLNFQSTSKVLMSDPINLIDARAFHTSTRLKNGGVLLTGGRVENPSPALPSVIDKVEVFIPEQAAFFRPTKDGSAAYVLSSARYAHRASVIGESGNDVLISGGLDTLSPTNSIEILSVDIGTGGPTVITRYEPQQNNTFEVGPIFHAAATLPGGFVVMAGGYNDLQDAAIDLGTPKNPSTTLELWSFDRTKRALTKVCSDKLLAPRGNAYGLGFTRADNTLQFFIHGGLDEQGTPTNTGELWTISLTEKEGCKKSSPDLIKSEDSRFDSAVVWMTDYQEGLFVGGAKSLSNGALNSAEFFSPLKNLDALKY